MSKFTDPIRDTRMCPKCGLDTIDARAIDAHIELCPDDWPAPCPRETTVRARDSSWPMQVWSLWRKHTKGRWSRDDRVSSANYFTPRPWRNEYNQGSKEAGFVYVVQPGNRVCLVDWIPEGPCPKK